MSGYLYKASVHVCICVYICLYVWVFVSIYVYMSEYLYKAGFHVWKEYIDMSIYLYISICLGICMRPVSRTH